MRLMGAEPASHFRQVGVQVGQSGRARMACGAAHGSIGGASMRAQGRTAALRGSSRASLTIVVVALLVFYE